MLIYDQINAIFELTLHIILSKLPYFRKLSDSRRTQNRRPLFRLMTLVHPMPAYGAPAAHAVVTRPPVEQPAAMMYVSARDPPSRGSGWGGETHTYWPMPLWAVFLLYSTATASNCFSLRREITEDSPGRGGRRGSTGSRGEEEGCCDSFCFVMCPCCFSEPDK